MTHLDSIQYACCYLIDDNHTLQKIESGKNQSLNTVKTLLKQIITSYQIWKKNEEKQMVQQISQVTRIPPT